MLFPIQCGHVCVYFCEGRVFILFVLLWFYIILFDLNLIIVVTCLSSGFRENERG